MTFESVFRWLGIIRLNEKIDPFEPVESPPPDRLMPFILWGLKGSYGIILVGMLAAGLGGTMDVSAAFLLGVIVDATLSSTRETVFQDNMLLFIGGILFFVLLRPGFFAFNSTVQNLLMSPNIPPQVHSRLHRWTLGQSVSFFDNDFAGRISQKQLQTASAITDVSVEFVNTVVFSLVSVAAAALMLSAMDWRAAVLLIIWMLLYVPFIRFFMPRVRVKSRDRASARAVVTGQIVDTVTNMRTVKLFAHRDHEDQAAIEAMKGYRVAAFDFGYVSVTFRTLLMLLAGLLPVMLISSSVVFWSRGEATAGQIAAIGAVSLRLSQMTNWVSFTVMGIYARIGEIEDGMRTLTPAHDLTDRPDAIDLPTPTGRIQFDSVGFTYGRPTGGITNLSLEIMPGEKVGLVGASGAGKSTLVATLMRLYDVEEGRITLDGHDVRDVTQESLRRQISMVTQETAMFNRSALDNIRYGSPDASEAEVIEAARKAEAHEFVLGLRDQAGREGYEAHLGERGVKLSGGQRQRIALARALLKNAPILVLDEATSALDSEVEAEIQLALEGVMDGKTVIAIAHRLSTIAQMDRIIVMDEGHIAEQGTHNELLARGGLYATFWQRQSGGFIGADAAE